MHERRAEGEVSFLAVASQPPATAQVVEPALCLGCLHNFYRVRPPLAMLGEKFCHACRAREEKRRAGAGDAQLRQKVVRVHGEQARRRAS